MYPTFHQKASRIIEQYHRQTLTIDIFDTILMNEYWPSHLRAYDLAKQLLPGLQTYISPKLTVYEIYDFYRYAEKQLLTSHQSLRIDLLLGTLIDSLCLKYHIDLNRDECLQLLTAMIRITMQFQIETCHINQRLIGQLQLLKTTYPFLRIYFVADSDFTTAQLKTMLEIFEVSIFDDGISSADHNATKQSGELYEKLSPELSPTFDLMYNLHIGDRRIPDYLMPILHDSMAIHYRPIRMRSLRTLVGHTSIKTLSQLAIRHDTSLIRRQYADDMPSTTWRLYGHLIASAYEIWSSQITLQSSLHPDEVFIITGAIATEISHQNPRPFDNSNVTFAPDLNRDTLLRAILWTLAYHHGEFQDTRNLRYADRLQSLSEKCDISYRELRTLAFASSRPTDFNTNSSYAQLLSEIITADAATTVPLREACSTVARYLSPDANSITLVTRGQDYTATLLCEFVHLYHLHRTIHEWNLDTIGLSSLQSRLSDSINSRRQQKICQGYTTARPILAASELAPDQYLKHVIRPLIKRLFKQLP